MEVHTDPEDWFRHGHHGDSAYSDVILHVAWAKPKATFRGPPTIALSSHTSLQDMPERDDRTSRDKWPCVDNFKSARADEVARMLSWQGWQRLVEKSHAYEAEIQVTSADEVLYCRVLDALGYSQNREPFAALAKLLNWEILKAFAEPGPEQLLVTEAMMFGTAGLLPLQRTDYSGTLPDDERSTHLAYIWGNLQFPSLDAKIWRFHGVRPNNWPTRRIAAACRIFSAHLHGSPSGALLLAVVDAIQEGSAGPLELLFSAPVAAGHYWARRIDFGRGTIAPSNALLGTSRAREIMVNVAIPMAICVMRSRGHASLVGSLRDLYFSTGSVSSNRITRYMAGLTGADELSGTRRAARQQGMLHIYRRWCRSKICAQCPAGFDGADTPSLIAGLTPEGAR